MGMDLVSLVSTRIVSALLLGALTLVFGRGTVVASQLAVEGQPTPATAHLIVQFCHQATDLAPIGASDFQIAVIGDSLAQGYGTSIPTQCGFAFQLPMQLPFALQFSRHLALTVSALGGQRVDQMAPYAPTIAASHPDLAVVELGTNDERESTALATTQSSYDLILQTISHATGTALAHPIIACLSIWPTPGYDNAAQLAPYNTIIQAECAKYNGVYVDITTIAQIKNATSLTKFTQNWHPNDYGAVLIAHQIAATVNEQQRFVTR